MKTLARSLAVIAFALLAAQFMPAPQTLAADDIPINKAHFPDAAFRAVISQKYDSNKDGVLSKDERSRTC